MMSRVGDLANPRSVRFQTTARAIVILALGLILATIAYDWLLGVQLRNNFDRQLEAQAADRASLLDQGADAGSLLSTVGDEEFVVVLDPSGAVISSVGLSDPSSLKDRLDLRGSGPTDVIVDIQEGAEVESERLRVAATASADGRSVIVGGDIEHAVDPQTNARPFTALGVVGLTLAGAALTWRNVGRSLAPVDRLRMEVDAIEADASGQRLTTDDNGDEVSALGATMNRLLGRLEAHGDAQRRFVSDASHELKSPVANVRAVLETTERPADDTEWQGLTKSLLRETERLQELIDDLLFLARTDEAGLRSDVGTVDLDDVVFSEAERLAATAGVRFDAGAVAPIQVTGSRAQLTRLMRNLLENASRYASSTVTISVSPTAGSQVVEIIIDDDGPGIPAAERQRVFDRFVRLDEARGRIAGGTGLGLSIAARIVEAHHGAIELDDSPTGGLRCLVRLPP